MIARILRTFRQRHAIRCLAERSAAKDALRQAKVRGDTRAQHEAQARLNAATTAQLKAEANLGLHREVRA